MINKVILMLAQSNGVGTRPFSELPDNRKGLKEDLRPVISQSGKVFSCINSEWNNNQYGEGGNNWSYEFELLDLSSHWGEQVYLAKYAVSATILADELVPNGSWNVNRVGERWDTLKSVISAVETWMDVRGKQFRFEAVIWHQGESDCNDLSRASSYAANELDLFNAINTEIGYTPFYYNVQINENISRTYQDTVRAAKAATVASNPDKYRLINQDDCTLYDGTHLDAESTIKLGQRIVTAIKQDIK